MCIRDSILESLQEINKNIPILPVAGVTIVGITGVRSKRVTKQVHLNMIINGVEYDNTFLVVRGLNLEVILGNDFLIKHKAVIDFQKRLLVLNNEGRPVEISFERVVDKVRISGVKMILNRASKVDTVVNTYACREGELGDNVNKRIWEDRAVKFCSEGRDVGSSQRKALWQVIECFREVFADVPGRARDYECELKVREHAPYVQRSYPVPYSKRRAVQAELDKMLEGDIIERSVSPYSNPLVVVIKKDGRVRLCLDARKINQIIIPDRESPEAINEIFQKFSGVKYMTSLDLTAGYWQVPLACESRKYTAFLFNGKNYQFKRLPFGLNISVASFIKCLDCLLYTSRCV